MLTVARIRTIKPEATTKRYPDEKSMYLEVTPKGTMFWRLRYRLDGKQNIFGIGSYPDLSLAEARIKRDEARKLIREGINPSIARRQAKVVQSGALTFEAVANQWMDDRKSSLTESSHMKNARQLKNDIFPLLGKMPIDTIKSPHLLEMARKIEERGAGEMARRALRLSGQVMRHGMRLGLIQFDPSVGVSEALKPRQVVHMERIEESEFPKLLRDIDAYTGEFLTKVGLKLIALTFIRTKELRFMEWTDIDFEKKELRIPGPKMKKRNVFIIPLAKQAIALLMELKPLTGHRQYVFYSTRSNKPISENTMICALWRMGYKGHMTVHGFRGLASTILHEKSYKHVAIEIQLSHTDKDQVSASYNYAEHLPYRHKMMQDWADYIDEQRGAIVTPLSQVVGK